MSTTEGIKIPVEFVGAQTAATSLDKVNDSLDRGAQNAQKFEAAQLSAAKANVEFTGKAAAAAAQITNFGRIIGDTGIAAVGGFAQAVVQSAQQGAALGVTFGPQGALVGGIVGSVIPAFSRLMSSLTLIPPGQEEVERSTRRATDSLNDQADAAVSASDALETFLTSVTTSSRRQQFSALGEEIAQVSDQIARLSSSGDAWARIEAMGPLQQRLQSLTGQAADMRAGLEEEGAFRTRRSGARKSASSFHFGDAIGADPFAEGGVETLMEPGDGAPTMSALMSQLSSSALFGPAGDSGVARAEKTELLANRARDEATQFSDAWRGGVQNVIDAFKELNAAAENAGTTMATQGEGMALAAKSVGNAALSDMGNGVAKGFAMATAAAIQSGESFEKVLGKQLEGLLASLLQESIVMGLKELALGIADTASYQYASAAMHYTAAGAWAAVAVASGGALAGVSAANKSGGGGGPTSRPAETAGAGSGNSRSSQPGTVVLNINGPLVSGSDAETGRKLQQILRAGQARYGAN